MVWARGSIKKLLPGQDWKLEIRKAVRESDVVVVCLSKQFNLADFDRKCALLLTQRWKPEWRFSLSFAVGGMR
jgi:hypothetical protein